jgi:hypothetical protein
MLPHSHTLQRSYHHLAGFYTYYQWQTIDDKTFDTFEEIFPKLLLLDKISLYQFLFT